jgi:hypothetical protein
MLRTCPTRELKIMFPHMLPERQDCELYIRAGSHFDAISNFNGCLLNHA